MREKEVIEAERAPREAGVGGEEGEDWREERSRFMEFEDFRAVLKEVFWRGLVDVQTVVRDWWWEGGD